MAVLFAISTACRPFGAKVKPEPAPLPPPPVPVEAKEPPKVEPPGPPPKIETKAPEPPAQIAAIPKPPAPRPKRRTLKKTAPSAVGAANTQANTIPAATKDQPATPDTAVTPPQPAANAAPLPKLGEIYSDDQKLQLQRSCDESLSRTREALGQLRGLNLSPEQRQSLARVRIFLSQAEQARTRDPQTAKLLAERADLLSRDLVRTVR